MKSLPVVLAVMSMLATNSFAMEWIIVPEARADGDIVCLDRDDVIQDHGIISVWIKRFKEGGDYTKNLLAVDCVQGKTKIVKTVEFCKATKMITTTEYESLWEEGSLGTPAKAASMMICKKSKGFNPALVSMKQRP